MITLNIQKETNQNCFVTSGSPLINFSLGILINFVIHNATIILKRRESIAGTLEICQFATFFHFILYKFNFCRLSDKPSKFTNKIADKN